MDEKIKFFLSMFHKKAKFYIYYEENAWIRNDYSSYRWSQIKNPRIIINYKKNRSYVFYIKNSGKRLNLIVSPTGIHGY